MARYLVSENDVGVAVDLAQQVERGEITFSSASNSLRQNLGFRAHTANAHLSCYPALLRGATWKATVSEQSLRFMMDNIAQRGANELFNAIQSVQGHIDYQAGRGQRTPGLGNLVSEYRLRLATVAQMPPATDDLTEQVRIAALDDREDRRLRLALAPKRPLVSVRLTQHFNRNPDVIAEVLDRALGVCERCSSPAPFSRRSDGSAYLEVHHKVRLADNGEDTVENAIALCPNCHRQQHHG